MESADVAQCPTTLPPLSMTDFQLLYRFVDFLKYGNYPIELDPNKVTVENCKKALELFKKE